MDNLEINLDDEFKNIDISSSNNDNMGIDLLMGTSPKKSDNDIKSVKSDDMNSPNVNNSSIETHQIFSIHNNIPGVISKISNIITSYGCNIVNSVLSTNENIGVCVISIKKKSDTDTDTNMNINLKEIKKDINKMEESLQTYIIGNLNI